MSVRRGSLRIWLRLEGAAVALIGTIVAVQLGVGWETVLLVLIAPDLAFFAYLAGPRIGAFVYNAAHSYLGPVLLLGLRLTGVETGPDVVEIAVLWAVHIGADRALGFGLKYPTDFSDTHLGKMGRAVVASPDP